MATSIMSLHRCCQQSALLITSRRLWSSGPASHPPPLFRRFLLFFAQRFYDVEMALDWGSRFKRKGIEKKNAYYAFTESYYGANIAAAYFVLSMKGSFRFVDQSEWFRAGDRGKFNWDFLNHKETKLEEVNMSHTIINYTGLENLEGQPLRTLSLQGCPEVDDWFLARLHILQDSLEELDISHCPRITTGGLAALRNLKGLRRLDISSLPGISHPGLVIILLEEMLPHCQIISTGYDLGLEQGEGSQEQIQGQQ